MGFPREQVLDEVQVINLPSRRTPKFNNLPRPITSFIGRGHDIAEVRQLLKESHLVTLTGMGGVGKTRLGLEIAAESLEDFEDGVCFVEIASISDPYLVEQEVCRSLGSMEGFTQPDIDTICKVLQAK